MNVREARELKGISAAAVAELLGITEESYLTAERLPDLMSANWRSAVAEFLGVPEDDLEWNSLPPLSLREVRMAENITTSEAARFLGISDLAYCELEKHPDLMSNEWAKALAGFYRVNLKDIDWDAV